MPQEASEVEDQLDLPATVRSRDHLISSYDSSQDLRKLLDDDLCIEKTKDVANHLWAVGRPYPPRALNIQLVLNRTIVPTNETSLHLVWTSGRIFIRVLPPYFLNTGFERFLHGTELHREALGLLHSYFALVPTELDFVLAQKNNLLPARLEWREWKALARRIFEHYPDSGIYHYIPNRYIYGELRLSRLNAIYRFVHGFWMDGYSTLTNPQTYGEFISRHLFLIGTGLIYLGFVLSAMQVGLSTVPNVSITNVTFVRVCYGFATFAMLAPLFAAGGVLLAALVMFFVNWYITVQRSDARFKLLGRDAPLCLRSSRSVSGKAGAA